MRAKFPVTVHLLFIREGKILLSLRYQTGYMDGWYSVPAGHLDGNEPVRQAAIREAMEEVGVKLLPGNLSFAGVIHRREGDERVDFFLQVKDWQGEPTNTEPHKCAGLSWVDLGDLPENTVPYVRRAIENFLKGIPFEEFGWGTMDPSNS